jgi:glutamyl-tRNA reductase
MEFGMSILTLGLNHQTAPLKIREQFAWASDQIQVHLQDFRNKFGANSEATVLSTCNRTEIYCAVHPQSIKDAQSWFTNLGGETPAVLEDHGYTLEHDSAARHAFRVASGLDSMVLGEPQILGQLKNAVQTARESGHLGSTLNQLFERSFSIAKKVRSSTEIGSHSISMAAAAVRLAGQLFEDFSETRVLFVGAGEMIELCMTHFAAKNPKIMCIANRNLSNGQALAKKFSAQAITLGEIPEQLHTFDAVISCTASTLPLIGLGAVESALKKRKNSPMFMLDLAVPRDIEPQVAELNNVYLYTVDHLANIVQSGKENRQAAVSKAEVIIDEGVHGFLTWLNSREDVPLIQRLHQKTDEWRELEISRAKKMIAKGDDINQVLEMLTKGLTQKMIHGAIAELHSKDNEVKDKAQYAIEHFFLQGCKRHLVDK